MDARSSMDSAVEPVSPADPTAPTPAARSAGPGGGHSVAPAVRSGVIARAIALKQSPWFSVATRGAAIFAGMLGLAAIGATSTLAGVGVPVALASASAAPAVSGVWIAPVASANAPSGGGGGGSAPAPGPGVTTDGKVILNTATAADLMKLPRVGAKRAEAILELRRKLGKFQRPTDLLRVHGIGRKSLKQLLPLVVVDAPSKPPG